MDPDVAQGIAEGDLHPMKKTPFVPLKEEVDKATITIKQIPDKPLKKPLVHVTILPPKAKKITISKPLMPPTITRPPLQIISNSQPPVKIVPFQKSRLVNIHKKLKTHEKTSPYFSNEPKQKSILDLLKKQ